MATGDRAFRLVPYRDTAGRIATEQSAETLVIAAFRSLSIGETPRVRSGYWYDLEEAGASAYDGSNEITFASGSNEITFASVSNKYGFPYMVVLSITVPQSKVFSFYGIADYTADPSLQAFQITQRDVAFPLIYLSPDLYTNEDHKVIFNGPMPAVGQNDSLTITLYGTAATTDKIDILFKVAEKSAQA
jgi:hypothetical protein